MPSAHLPPTAFVLFLQNHDQIGNRAFGERLTTLVEPAALEAAIALQMLCPQIPLLFMGEESASPTPFLFFTDHGAELADAVREGRRGEFAKFPAFADPATRERIPDPNAPETFAASVPRADPVLGSAREALYHDLLALRRTYIVPRLDGARALAAEVIGSKAVVARWQLGDAAVLTIATNLGADGVALEQPAGALLFASRQATGAGLPGHCTCVFLDAGQARDV
jgi:maltooligosyltrehalose trehalohydrolase